MSLNLKRQTIQQRILTLLDKLPTETLVVIEQIVQLLYRQLRPTDKTVQNDEASRTASMADMFELGHENVNTKLGVNGHDTNIY
ncbi:hypothetical protein QUF58_06455 [Anaerolineales bacterium HSG24]|nr:hypothetical protein [Anaerolineales bacterium HSG24]